MNALIKLAQLNVLRDGKPVLNEIQMTLMPHDRLVITGPNGAGKTTLLRTMVGLQPADSGEIVLFGQPCRHEADFCPQRPKIGFLFQDSDDQLFCPGVIEDVAFGPLNTGATREQARARAVETLGRLGIAHLADRLTHRLSAGEKRLVCLAGILAMNPQVLLLDEPTNGVDAENSARLRSALRAFNGAMIIVSHNDRFVAGLVTRGLRLSLGRLEETAVPR